MGEFEFIIIVIFPDQTTTVLDNLLFFNGTNFMTGSLFMLKSQRQSFAELSYSEGMSIEA